MSSEIKSEYYDPSDPNPGFYDVYDSFDASELTWSKRIARRYFITHNYERSIKVHEALGSKVIRKVVMGTAGKLRRERYNSNYHIGVEGSPLDRAAKYAFKGSVINEVIHGAQGYLLSAVAIKNLIEDGNTSPFVATFGAINLGLVALQRYNRARMINYLDDALSSGRGFSEEYQSWTDVDASSLGAARLALQQEQLQPPNQTN
jgi:hypothetical protein